MPWRQIKPEAHFVVEAREIGVPVTADQAAVRLCKCGIPKCGPSGDIYVYVHAHLDEYGRLASPSTPGRPVDLLVRTYASDPGSAPAGQFVVIRGGESEVCEERAPEGRLIPVCRGDDPWPGVDAARIEFRRQHGF